MARWTELLLLLALLGSGGQAVAPGVVENPTGAPRAILLQDAELYAEPSSSGSVMSRLPAGTVLEYAGETSDAFGRTWYALRDPQRLVRRGSPYMVPFDLRRWRDLGYRGALLADRQPLLLPLLGAAAIAAAAPDDEPWWRPVATLELGDAPVFEDVVGVSARAADEGELRRAIELLGGLDAIAHWPAAPIPGELFVPDMLPALFQYDGAAWDLARPVRLLGDAVSLIGNGTFVVDAAAPPLAGGPALYCWDLVNVLDPAGELAGSLAVAAERTAARRGDPPPRDMGQFDIERVPERLRGLLPPAPDTTLVPPRIDGPAAGAAVLLADTDGQQAVFLRQTLGSELTHRLQGLPLVLDVVARDDPRAGAATFGVDIEVRSADGRTADRFSTSFTSRPAPRRYEVAFEMPADADEVIVRLLPLDRDLAVEQQGSVVFERVGLRLPEWDASPPAATVVLYRITAYTYEGGELYTRAPVARTHRGEEELRVAWAQVAGADWPIEEQMRVLAGELRHGMTPEQVEAAWGSPAQRTTRDVDGAVEWRWGSDDRFALFDADGRRVVVFRPPTRVDPSTAPLLCPAR